MLRPTSRPVLPLVVAVSVDSIGAGLFVPVSLLFFPRVAGLPLTLAGVLATTGALLALPVPLLAGWLADRQGPRAPVVAGQLVQAAGFTGYLLARDVASILVVIGLVAVGQRLFWSTFFTLVAALPTGTGEERARDRSYALVGMAQSAGYGVGALVTGVIVTAGSTAAYLGIAAANAVTFVVSAALIGTVPLEGGRGHASGRSLDGYRRLLGDRAFLGLTAVNTAFCVASVFLAVALPVYVVQGLHGPGWVVGAVLAANTVLLSVGQLAVTRAVRGLSRIQALLIAGAAWTAWSLLTAASADVPAHLVVAYLAGVTVLYAAAELVHAPVSNALAAEAAPRQARGAYLAVFQYGFTLATIVVPAAFTTLFVVDPRLPWLALAVLTAAATAVTAVVGRHLPSAAVHPGRPRCGN